MEEEKINHFYLQDNNNDEIDEEEEEEMDLNIKSEKPLSNDNSQKIEEEIIENTLEKLID